MSFKLSIETHDDVTHLLDNIIREDRADALSAFDTIRRTVQRMISERGTSHVRAVTLLTDDQTEAPQGWDSGDSDFPWIVDGESYDRPREHPVPCILCGIGHGPRGQVFKAVTMTWNSSAICYRHG